MDDVITENAIIPVAKALVIYGTKALLMHRCESCAVGPIVHGPSGGEAASSPRTESRARQGEGEPVTRVGPGSWEFAGGKLEFGETPEEALSREVREETGLRLTPEKLLYTASWMPLPNKQYVVLYYLCHAPSDEITLSEEHTGYQWVGRAELQRLLPRNMWEPLAQSGVLETLGIEE